MTIINKSLDLQTFTLTLLLTSTALQSALRRGWDLWKLRFIFLVAVVVQPFQKVQPLPTNSGALVPGDPLGQNPTDSSTDASGFVGFISRPLLIWLFPDVCPSDRSELSTRTGGDQLAASTREWSFQMTSALPKNGILWDIHRLRGISCPRGKSCLFTS